MDDDVHRVINKIRSSSGVLYILCGYPYAGKSFIARQILEKTGAVHVSIDAIFHTRGFDWDTDRLPNADEWRAIFEESYALTQKGLSGGKNVLYDSTNQTIGSRDKLREVARSVGTQAYVIFVKSDEATVWERWEESAKGRNRPIVNKKLVAETIASFEIPTEKEDVLVVRN